jgi:PAS domain S-box-containing protein
MRVVLVDPAEEIARERRSRRFAVWPQVFVQIASSLAILVGGSVLLGWALNVVELKSILPGLASMKPNTALGFVLAGVSLRLMRTEPGSRRTIFVGIASAALVVGIGLLTLVEYIAYTDLGIDQVLIRDTSSSPYPGRMAPAMAVNFLLLGTALLLLDTKSRRYAVAQPLALGVAVISLLSLIGYLYGVQALYRLGPFSSVAFHSAATFFVLAGGVLFARRHRGLIALALSPSLGGVLIRRQLPAFVLLIFLAGWLRLRGQSAGVFDTAAGTALLVVVSIIIFGVLVLWTGWVLHRADLGQRESAERLRLAQAVARIGTFEWNVQTGVNRWTPDLEKMYGLQPGEFAGTQRSWEQLVHPDDRAEAVRRVAEAVEQGSFEGEWRVVWPDGSVHWLAGRAWMFKDEAGRPFRLIGVNIDVTKQKQAENAVRTSESRLKLFIDHAPAAIAMFDRDMRYLAVSRRWRTDYGLEGDVLGKSHYEVLPEVPDRWRIVHAQGLAGEVLKASEDPFERADGTTQWVRWEVRPWHTSEGAVGGIVIFAEDISEHKRAEERFRFAVEAAPNGMIMTDPNGKIVLANVQAEKLFGYARDELLGQPVEVLVAERFRLSHPQFRRAFLAAPGARPMGAGRDLHGRRKDGREIPVEIGLNPIRTGEGVFVLAAVIDVSERKSALEELHALTGHLERVRDEERTRIAREIHDELGQALTALKLDLAWMRKRIAKEWDREPAAPLLEKAEEMAELIDSTVQTVRRVAAELRPGILDDFGLTAALEWQSQEFMKRTGIRCDLTLAEIDVGGQRAMALFRIIQEALTNVARHAGATEVGIRLQREGDELILEVRDNGQGFADQKHRPRSFGIQGMRERAILMGGTLEVVSRPGEGTTVTARVLLGENRTNPDSPAPFAEVSGRLKT